MKLFTVSSVTILSVIVGRLGAAEEVVAYQQGTWMQGAESQNARSDDLAASTNVDTAVASSSRRRRRYRNKVKQQKEKDRYADDDYYYDRDDEYGSPKAPASNYEAPAASSYNPPAPSYAAPSYQAPAAGYGAPPSYEATGGGGGGGGGYGPEQTPQQQLPDDEVDQRAVPFTGYGDYDFDLYQYPSPVVQVIKQNTNKRIAAPAAAAADGFNDFLNALAAFLPIGLFLAAIPPNIITINTSGFFNAGALAQFANSLATIFPIGLFLASLAPNTITITGRKKRSMNDVDDGETYVYPFLEDIKNTGYAKLNNPECQKRLFCKMASYGGHSEDANTVQKTFFYAATLFPSFLTSMASHDISETFDAVQTGSCDAFHCG